jgi:choline-sulfatase
MTAGRAGHRARGERGGRGRRRLPVLLGGLVVVVLAGLLVGRWWFWPGSGAPPIPLVPRADQNVLLVTIDTLRADALGCYGGRAATPTLDAIARAGVRFDFAHAHAVVTLPSHASILTGLYPYQHGIRDNSGYTLRDGIPTLATILRGRGYATGAFVAAFVLDRRFGLDAGFDTYDDRLESRAVPTDIAMPERRAEAVVARARAWVAAQAGRWFAWVHLFDPHAPYAPPPPFDREYAERPYDGEVAYADAMLAPLVAAVRAAPRPTLVVVTADHGEGLGDHDELTHGLFAYEPTLRVPLLVAQLGPGRAAAAAGGVAHVAARHVDLLPTILDALGIDPPPDLPGRSLLRAARGGDEPPSYFEAMSASLNRGWAPLAGVLAGRVKYIDLPIAELYDLATDPEERTNLAARDPARRRVLERLLAGFRAAPPEARGAIDQEVAERLRALGYVTGRAPRRARYTEADDPKRRVDLDRAIHRGIALIEGRRWAEAAATYREILERQPDLTLAARHLAFVEWVQGEPQRAIATLRAAAGRGAADSALAAQLAVYLAEAGAPAEAIALLEPASRGAPADLDLLNALGIAYARAGRIDDALRTFDAVLARNPDQAMALQNAAAALLARGEAEAARTRFLRALEIDPTLARAYTGLGVANMQLGRQAEAIDAWRRAVELDGREFDALYNLAIAFARAGRVGEARAYGARFVHTAPPALYGAQIAELRRRLALP